MTPQEKEIENLKGEIETELRAIFKANLKIFDWDIPENDDRKAANLILDTMQEVIDKIRQEVKEGKYDNY